MKIFMSLEDVAASGLAGPVRELAGRLVEDLIRIYADEGGAEWDAETEGHVVLVEATDGPEDKHVVEHLGYPLHLAPLEGASYDEASRCFLTCLLWSNECGVTIAVQDHPGLDPRLRARLEEDLASDEVWYG